MKILAIETSCDETAVAILKGTGDENGARFTTLGNALLSQIDIHKEYGGVFPALAKRAHAKNLTALLSAALEEAELRRENGHDLPEGQEEALRVMLEREPELADALIDFLKETERPDLDALAVTHGPGLEPALWVGINFARALSLAWNIPVVPVNHMEGHLLSALTVTDGDELVTDGSKRPILGLLISGGHTELVLMKDWLSYDLIGQTRDDAVGEAYDKVARMMGLPYPGGPEVSKLADKAHDETEKNPFLLPRPMLNDGSYDFSFSGLKTAVLYLIKEKGELSELEKEQMSRAFEDAVAEVLWKKTASALEATEALTLTIGGGVSANARIRRDFTAKIAEEFPHVSLVIPPRELSTDNAIMIGIAGYFRALRNEFVTDITANGTLSLAKK
jgi:N6-L-threonylcarbamoyladenine synthase